MYALPPRNNDLGQKGNKIPGLLCRPMRLCASPFVTALARRLWELWKLLAKMKIYKPQEIFC